MNIQMGTSCPPFVVNYFGCFHDVYWDSSIYNTLSIVGSIIGGNMAGPTCTTCPK